jgi:hypothetical protein
MEIVYYESSDHSLSVVKAPKRKATKEEAGFITPVEYISKKIEKDRFCCGNCIRYIHDSKACYIVEGKDIEDLDCCNQFLDERMLKNKSEKQHAFNNQEDSVKIYIPTGALSSKEIVGVVNGISWIKVDDHQVSYNMRRLSFDDDIQESRKSKRKTKKITDNSSCIIL